MAIRDPGIQDSTDSSTQKKVKEILGGLYDDHQKDIWVSTKL
jgi:hypothetical protein